MASILDWRDDGELPRCEMLLASGEHVTITLNAGGVQIDLLDHGGRRGTCLFQGNVETATDICMGLLADKPPHSTTPLRILATAVAAMPTAEAVRGAFTTAARGLESRRTSGVIPRAIVVAILLFALALASGVAYQALMQAPG